MTRSQWPALAGGILGLAVLTAGTAHAGTVTVNTLASIYDAGNSPLQYSTVAPTLIGLSGATSVTFTSVTGSAIVNVGSGDNTNDPDGVGAGAPSSSSTGTAVISGITAPGAGYLVGLFVDGTVPSGTPPAALNFTSGAGHTPGNISFTSLSPALDQTFFIGDGQTADGTGTTQVFNAPTGATTLYLGLSDACNYNGSPGCYDDNSGTYSVTYGLQGASNVPEPASIALLASALLGTALVRRRARRAAG